MRYLSHTIRKVKFLSKNSILTKPQHFHDFFTPIFWQFFSWNQICQQLKSPKPQHFHEFFTPKNRQFSRKIKVAFLDKNWRFLTVWFFRGHSSYINCVAVVDIYVITGSADSTLRKWDMTTCECLFVYEGHTARVQKILCTGDFIFSSSKSLMIMTTSSLKKTSRSSFTGYDKTVKAFLFDTSELDEGSEDKACIRTFKGHNKGVYPLIFIPAEESYCLPDTQGPVINPGDLLISGSADSTARSWSFDTGSCLKIFKGHAGAVTTMATDAIGKILYTAGADALIKSWNISTGQVLKVNL